MYAIKPLHSRYTDTRHDLPDADHAIGVAREESLAVAAPGEGNAARLQSALAHWREVRAQLVDNSLGLEVPDLDALLGGCAQPVAVRGEQEAVDNVASLQLVQVLALRQVPQLRGAVLAAGGAQRAVRGDSDGVDVGCVLGEVAPQLAVGQVPHCAATTGTR